MLTKQFQNIQQSQEMVVTGLSWADGLSKCPPVDISMSYVTQGLLGSTRINVGTDFLLCAKLTFSSRSNNLKQDDPTRENDRYRQYMNNTYIIRRIRDYWEHKLLVGVFDSKWQISSSWWQFEQSLHHSDNWTIFKINICQILSVDRRWKPAHRDNAINFDADIKTWDQNETEPHERNPARSQLQNTPYIH